MSGNPPIDLADIYRMLADGVLTITPALDVDGADEALTREVLEAVIEHKPLILYRLSREVAWEELSAQRWGPGLNDDEPGIVIDGPTNAQNQDVIKGEIK